MEGNMMECMFEPRRVDIHIFAGLSPFSDGFFATIADPPPPQGAALLQQPVQQQPPPPAQPSQLLSGRKRLRPEGDEEEAAILD
ncbi:hypothetical protein TSOC_004325 [Tetrabaena socialis]|uniref:Uncharacterized protein n=1 Tax=Tetrabaena socialis TaxID=47790 RepID=A0A2J8A9B6_9CHLO|nr:hypothetical protein TSOC_004325 [Tetrabaena socialis]|eukprot:PNH09073.1 hypothetical protein TSOC_004325 [Tetrabaena socialis]